MSCHFSPLSQSFSLLPENIGWLKHPKYFTYSLYNRYIPSFVMKSENVKRNNQINKRTYVSKCFSSLLYLSSWLYRTCINCLASILLEPIIPDIKTLERVGLFHRLVSLNFYKKWKNRPGTESTLVFRLTSQIQCWTFIF